jgi:hypothetical protein
MGVDLSDEGRLLEEQFLEMEVVSSTIWQTFHKASESGVHCISPACQSIQLHCYIKVLLADREVPYALRDCYIPITSQTHQIPYRAAGFRREADANWALLGYYASSIGNFSPTNSCK